MPHPAVSRPLQADFLTVPQSPLCYWLRPKFFELLAGKTLGDVADVCQGLATADDDRFVRFTWETPLHVWAQPVQHRRWVPFEKGGGYGKWYGHHFWTVDWEFKGARISGTPCPRVQNEQHYFQEGWTYSYMARGSLGLRKFEDSIFAHKSPGIFERSGEVVPIANGRIGSMLARAIAASVQLPEGCVARVPFLPVSSAVQDLLAETVRLKKELVSGDLLERTFKKAQQSDMQREAMLHAVEGSIEQIVLEAFELSNEDRESMFAETGTPVGLFPLLEGSTEMPTESPFLSVQPSRRVETEELSRLRHQLQRLYSNGPGAKSDEDGDSEESEDEEEDDAGIGGRIPVPSETFLEELSQATKVHPITVYRLLKEGRESEGWRCLPEERRVLKDRLTVLLLQMAGHQWPIQIEHAEPLPKWADYDGILTVDSSLFHRIRERVPEQFNQTAADFERSFQELMNTSMDLWVSAEFFESQISQFRKRPLLWQVSSSPLGQGRKKSADVPVYTSFLYYHKLTADMLPSLRSRYIGALRSAQETELRTLERTNTLTSEQAGRKIELAKSLEELKSFEDRLQSVISKGFGPESLTTELRQHAIEDATLCLKSSWLRKAVGIIRSGPLTGWLMNASDSRLHEDLPRWIEEVILGLPTSCSMVPPEIPDESTFAQDPDAAMLAALIAPNYAAILNAALTIACGRWFHKLDAAVLKPIREQIAAGKVELDELKSEKTISSKERIRDLKARIKDLKDNHLHKNALAVQLRSTIVSWRLPEAASWENWLASQPLYDEISSADGKRSPPSSVQAFIDQESLYIPDINDGVRVNIAPIQRAGLLAANVLPPKDVDTAISDRAKWRADERRWCREGRLPRPGWWL